MSARKASQEWIWGIEVMAILREWRAWLHCGGARNVNFFDRSTADGARSELLCDYGQ